MKKKIVAFCPADNNNWEKFGKQMLTSLRKFHSEEDLPLLRFDNPNPNDKDFWYRAAPVLASKLLKEYETVIKMDSDQIILGSLDDLIFDKEEYDVGVVLNDPTYPIQIWDIRWPYFNNGLVVLKSPAFAEHWKRLCFTPHFYNMQFREQDVLNILCSDYMNYKVKILDNDKIYGEWAKPNWAKCYIKDDKVMLNIEGYKNNNLENPDRLIQLCVYHSGGGNTPDKGNFRIRFSAEVCKFIDKLIK